MVAAKRYSMRARIGGLVEIIYDLKNMPRTMKQLALVTVFTWFALFAMFIYMHLRRSPAIILAAPIPTSGAYNDGANWVGVLMAVYNGAAAFVAFLLPVMARKTSRVTTHVICLFIGGLGLISMMLFKDPNMLIISMTAWASPGPAC